MKTTYHYAHFSQDVLLFYWFKISLLLDCLRHLLIKRRLLLTMKQFNDKQIRPTEVCLILFFCRFFCLTLFFLLMCCTSGRFKWLFRFEWGSFLFWFWVHAAKSYHALRSLTEHRQDYDFTCRFLRLLLYLFLLGNSRAKVPAASWMGVLIFVLLRSGSLRVWRTSNGREIARTDLVKCASAIYRVKGPYAAAFIMVIIVVAGSCWAVAIYTLSSCVFLRLGGVV